MLKVNGTEVKRVLYTGPSKNDGYLTNYDVGQVECLTTGSGWVKVFDSGTLDNLVYTLLEDGTYSVKANGRLPETCEIPSEYNGKPVTVIAESAFQYNNEVLNWIIPEGVIKIDSYAFYGCSIYTISLPSTLERIENFAFFGSYSYGSTHATITIPSSVTYIGNRAFTPLLSNNYYHILFENTVGWSYTDQNGEVHEIPSTTMADPDLAYEVLQNLGEFNRASKQYEHSIYVNAMGSCLITFIDYFPQEYTFETLYNSYKNIQFADIGTVSGDNGGSGFYRGIYRNAYFTSSTVLRCITNVGYEEASGISSQTVIEVNT